MAAVSVKRSIAFAVRLPTSYTDHYLNISFQFPVSALNYEKCVVSKGYYNIQTYLSFLVSLWFKMEQTLPRFRVTHFTSASYSAYSACFESRPFSREFCYLAETISSFQDTFNVS